MSNARLARFSIERLFGLYDHIIELNLDERITIIIGPNGRGKTVCLKFIEALFRKRYAYFDDIPFYRAEFLFSNGDSIEIRRAEEWERDSDDGTPEPGLLFCLNIAGKDHIQWRPAAVDAGIRRDIRRYVPPQWDQVAPDLWIDQTDGEELSLVELASRYHLPPKLISSLRQEIPGEFLNLIGGIDCHLIETQRLLVLPSGPAEEEHDFGYMPRRRNVGSRLAIQQKAQKLRSIMKDTIANYANLSQSLDRSFPLRVIEAQGSTMQSQEELRKRLKLLDQKREALMSAGILDSELKTVTMKGGNIEPGVAMVLDIYVNDTIQKLDVFNGLRARLDLFKELIERRFIDKTLLVDREGGFRVVSKTGLDVPLEKLSSGEQHQLILVFDLLFEVTENSLILIDEPELSLHVAWQKSFIESLRRIIELNAFDVLLATHSPAVVARHFDLAVELGPVDG